MADVIIAQNAALAAERSLYDTYSLILFSTDKRERHKIVGFHDATRLATLHNSAMPGPLTPRRTKARCAVMMIRPYKPRDSAIYLSLSLSLSPRYLLYLAPRLALLPIPPRHCSSKEQLLSGAWARPRGSMRARACGVRVGSPAHRCSQGSGTMNRQPALLPQRLDMPKSLPFPVWQQWPAFAPREAC